MRNQFGPLLYLTGFAFADGPRRFSPIVSNMRLSTTESSSTDLQIDYDSERHRFESAGISGGLNRGQGFANIAYFFRRNTSIQFPSNQFRGIFGYGNEMKPGVSFALSAAYDIQRSLFQESVTQLRYNFDCYGLSLEFMQTNLGERKESRIRFAFSLKNIGTFGTIRRQDRIF
jgi:LPS-assembly protein